MASGAMHYSRRDIDRAVALGEAVGSFWQYCEDGGSCFTVEWELKGKRWAIIATYDADIGSRDAEAEDTFYYFASMNAPFAEAIVMDTEGNRLDSLAE